MVGHRIAAAALVGALAGVIACAHGEAPENRIPGADLGELGERTTELTGAPLPGSLHARLVDRQNVSQILERNARSEWSEGEARGYAEGLTAMGLWPVDEDLLASLVRVSQNHLHGFYLPDDETIYVIDDAGAPSALRGSGDEQRNLGREFVVAHELIHAHQHTTHPELLEFFTRWHSQDDAANAASAAVEGHALRAAMELYVEPHELPTPEVVAKYFGAEPRGSLAELPALLRLAHAFPYVRGYPLAYREGLDLLDRAPASTEQVMHKERRDDDFWAMDLAGVDALLPGDCDAVHQNTLGELGISVLFDELAESPDAEIWTGWDGDRYLVARCAGQRALLWLTAWDTPEDARQFAESYAMIAGEVARRAGLAAVPRVTLNGSSVVVASAHLGGLVHDVDEAVRKARVATLPELRAHFE